MGKSLRSIPFWSDEIVLDVHSATDARMLGEHSLREITGGGMAALYEVDDGDYHVEMLNREFATGRPVFEKA